MRAVKVAWWAALSSAGRWPWLVFARGQACRCFRTELIRLGCADLLLYLRACSCVPRWVRMLLGPVLCTWGAGARVCAVYCARGDVLVSAVFVPGWAALGEVGQGVPGCVLHGVG